MTPEVQALIDQTARHHAAETARVSRETDAEIMRKAAEPHMDVPAVPAMVPQRTSEKGGKQ